MSNFSPQQAFYVLSDAETLTVRGTNETCRAACWQVFDHVKQEFGDLGWKLSLNKENARGKRW